MLPLSLEKYPYSLVDSADEGEETNSTAHSKCELVWRRRFYILLAIFVFTFPILIMAFIYRLTTFSCPSPKPGVTIPYCKDILFREQNYIINNETAPAPVTYVNKWLKGDPDTPKFMGQPRPEMDEAWHDLLSATAIRLSEEELALANNATSIRHIDGGYVGGLGISHSLHCVVSHVFLNQINTSGSFPFFQHLIFLDQPHTRLILSANTMRQKRIKQYLHPEYYYQGEQAWEELFSHADHCLESLRQTVMCSADVSVYALKWTPHSRYKPSVMVPQPHACVDWEALHLWMSGRAASLDDIVGPPEDLYEGIEKDPGNPENQRA